MRFEIDKSIYSKEVLLKTAYSFTDRAYLHLLQADNSWIVDWTCKEDNVISFQDFENELISQQLREELLEKAADIRKLVLARAFASTIIEESEDISVESAPLPDEELSDNDRILKGWFDHDD